MMFKSFLPKVRTENRERRDGRRCVVYRIQHALCRCVMCDVCVGVYGCVWLSLSNRVYPNMQRLLPTPPSTFFRLPSSFLLPKIAAIPAGAIPFALLGSFGHIPPVDGNIMCQPPYGPDDLGSNGGCVRNYLRVMAIGLPAAFSLAAFVFKVRTENRERRDGRRCVVHRIQHALCRCVV